MRTLDDVRRFLRQSQVSAALAIRVTKSVHERLLEEHALGEDDVDGLRLLSTKLRSELAFQIRRPHVLKHALFRLWAQIEEVSVEELCRDAVEFQFLFPGDVLFRPAQALQQAYYVVSGSLQYTQLPETSKVDNPNEATVAQDSWIAEAALWSKWQHVGKLEAITECQIMVIRLDGILKVLEGDTDLRRAVSHATRNYGQNFWIRLTGLKPPTPQPSDVSVPFADSPDLMAPDISRGLLRRLQREHPEADKLQDLQQEVATGRCVLRENADGDVERVVFLVTFRIEDDGDTLLQLGFVGDGGRLQKGNLELPGTKRPRDELEDEARSRVLSKLGSLTNYINMGSEHEEVWEDKSHKFNVPTQYRRAENYVTLKFHRQIIDEAMRTEARVAEPQKSCTVTADSTRSFLFGPSKSFKKFDLPFLQQEIPMVYVISKSGGEAAFYGWISQKTRELLLNDREGVLDKYLESLTYQDLDYCYRI